MSVRSRSINSHSEKYSAGDQKKDLLWNFCDKIYIVTKISVIVVISQRQLSTRQLTGLVLLGNYMFFSVTAG